MTRASGSTLDQLHNLFATYLIGLLEPYEDEETGQMVQPNVSAPTMAVIAKFLKDNNIAAVDDDDDETAALKASLRSRGRRAGFSDTDIELALEGAEYGRAH